MAQEKSWVFYLGKEKMSFKNKFDWLDFQHDLTGYKRFLLDESQQNFINEVRDTAHKRAILLKKGSIFYRAQNGFDRLSFATMKKRKLSILAQFDKYPLPPKRMNAPSRAITKAGRANPAGIPVLYLATSPETAISETRPWKGAYVTVAKFQLREEIAVVDLTAYSPRRNFSAGAPPSDEELEDYIWNEINDSFSLPYSPENADMGYLPTQCVAEALKGKYYGLLYSSALCPKGGKNLVLFSPFPTHQKKKRSLHYINSVSYGINQA